MYVNWGVVLAVWSSSGKASSKKSEAWASEFRAVRAGATQQYVYGVPSSDWERADGQNGLGGVKMLLSVYLLLLGNLSFHEKKLEILDRVKDLS